VELLGGKICAESEANKGSTFYFCLPLLLTTSKDSPGEILPRAPNQGVFDTQSCKSTGVYVSCLCIWSMDYSARICELFEGEVTHRTWSSESAVL